ncbi:hypothetical protein HPP92_018427 [Vanilla planifolia]|uniref:Protein LURP-one-related 8 n=1 Tax=Vanilla planifolia TaxID=51239 RepID=A0A835QB38_VANPL|nr:hypothetical protein HPP92_018427 [Vanilla planifolia]
MTRVHPNSPLFESPILNSSSVSEDLSVLTVWQKSLLLNCSGFTVFDSNGNLKFRVDNYPSSNFSEIVLMDAAGKPLFTLRRKWLSFADHWYVYDGEAAPSSTPRFSVRKHVSFLRSNSLLQVTTYAGGGQAAMPVYDVEGSFSRRSCVVNDEKNRTVAKILRKETVRGADLGGDVFRLVVQPGFDAGLAMTFVILLERMFGSGVTAIDC